MPAAQHQQNADVCNGTQQCICSVCSCGHHSCPPGRAHNGIDLDQSPFAGASEYEERYKQYETPAPPKKVVQPYRPNSDKLEGSSTSKQDYQAWPVQRHQPHQHAPYTPNPDKFVGQSVTSEEYKAWDVQRRQVKQVDAAKLTPEDRTWETNSRSSYQGQAGEGRYHHEREAARPLWDGNKFEGQSVALSDYTAKPIHRDAPIKPPASMHLSNSRFEGQSVASADYTEKPIHRDAPIKPPASMHLSEGRFEGQSVATSDYTAKPIHRDAPIKPPASMHLSEGRFEGQSVATSDYTAKPIHRDAPIKPPASMHLSNGRFEGQSVANSDYTAKPIHRDAPIKPPASMHLSNSKFDAHSMYQDTFVPKEAQAQWRHAAPAYVPNPDRFEGESSSKHDYQGQTAPRTESFKPRLIYNPDAETRVFETENKQMYDAKQREHCRVFDMANMQTEKAKDGHVYYKQTA